MPEKFVGQPLPRIDAVEKVRGEAIFGADVNLPHMLVAKFLPSPHAHAEILSIDTSIAETLPGVQAVVTAADIPETAVPNPTSRLHAFLARQFIVFAGQAVAAVAAEDSTTAEAAIELIDVKYRPLPVVNTLHQAIQPDCVAVMHEQNEAGGKVGPLKKSANIVAEHIYTRGNTVVAFAESDIIVERTYTVPIVHQGYIEPHAVTAHWDRPAHLTVWECVQGAFAARDLIAQALDIPQTNITLNTTEIGGGFGGKVDGIFAPLVALLARKAGRPVQLILTRQEELIGANPAPASIIRLKSGAKKDGSFTAIVADVLVEAGAFPTGWIMNVITVTLRDNYQFKAWHLRGREVLTNKASAAAYRAPGGPNVAFAMESQVDEMARQLNIDTMTIRLHNLIREGDTLANKEAQGPIGAREVLTALAEHPAWNEPPPPRLGTDGYLHGRGLALGSWAGGTGPAGATAILETGGKFRIVLGTVDLSGSFTSLAQIAADALGVSIDQIVISKASPDYARFAPMSAGSQTIYAMGAAVKDAALNLQAKMVKITAQDLNITEAELAVNNEGVYVIAQPNKCHSFEMLYHMGTGWLAEFGPLVGEGSAPPRQRAPGFAATIAEVAVNPETGKVTITRLITAQDVGKAINPLSVEGQLQGAAAQSVGIALWEEIIYDKNGRVRNPSLLDYHQPTMADIPKIETIIVERPGGDGPFGAKLAGEPPMIPPVAAVANAIAAAIESRVCDLPIKPERVWKALAQKH